MIIHFPAPLLYRPSSRTILNSRKIQNHFVTRTAAVRISTAAGAVVIAAAVVMTSMDVAAAVEPPPLQDSETMSNVPQTLSGQCGAGNNDCKKARIQRPKSRKAESCTVKCVNTCIRGGDGAPGEGPLNIRRPLVVFKEGFRSRNYCLVECSDICNLIGDGDYGP